MQTQIIDDWQKTDQSLQITQEKMISQIEYLKDIKIVLSYRDDGSVNYEKSTKVVDRFKQKSVNCAKKDQKRNT